MSNLIRSKHPGHNGQGYYKCLQKFYEIIILLQIMIMAWIAVGALIEVVSKLITS